MKRKIVFLVVAALTLIGCKNDKFALDVTLDPSLLEYFDAGDELGLFCRQGGEWIKIDSTCINDDGTFSFKGHAGKPVIAYVNSQDENLLQFVLEQGKIKATIDQYGLPTISGTPNNELLSDFYHGLNDAEDEKESIDFLNSFVEKNINNVVGYTMMADYLFVYDIQEIDDMVDKMTEDTKAQPIVKDGILDKVAVMHLTSVGNSYQDITLSTPEGKSMNLSDFVGRSDFLIIDFWASWCGPCRRAMPQLVELYDKYYSDGVLDIVGLSLDEDSDAWLGAIDKLGLKWHHLSDLQGWKSSVAELYGVSAIPFTLLLDKNGIIVARNKEPMEYGEIIEQSLN